MAATQEGAVVGRVGLGRQPEEQRLGEAQCQRELTPQLPHAVQQQQEDRGLLLEAGVGVRRVGTALPERVSCLEGGALLHSLPAAVARLGLEPSARHASLQRLLSGARVDDEASVRAVNHSPEEALVLHAALPVGARQRLTAAHDDLRSDW
ncbi:hypothetical protein EYF80_006737 [Liparis tanakae]|uniref:Uncharacterized protein n=1 Tax=Liparis tanakae TaxID=230148 RepID=A0A4Z2IYS1_9TELE|nr:hypothetical protein EYF80_006737 [Liparis tanakae]